MNEMDEARARIEAVKAGIETACLRCGRNPGDVTLIGASKTVGWERLEEFEKAGLSHFGENYIQEGIEKVTAFEAEGLGAKWHFIGSLQSNKAREAVRYFEVIHSLDRLSLARELNKAAGKVGKVQQVLLQVNLGGESTKAGVEPEGLRPLWESCEALENLQVKGLMSLPPYLEDVEEMRPFHRSLRELGEDIWGKDGPTGSGMWLSMGMTHDYEVAIEEGSTHVRVGTGLFGQRR